MATLNLLIERLRKVFTLDSRSLFVFRVLFSLVLLFTYLYKLSEVYWWYSPEGLVNAASVRAIISKYFWSLLFLYDSELFAYLLLISGALLSLALMFDGRWWVRLLNWIIFISIYNRNTLIIDAAHRVVLLLSFWSIFLPLSNTALRAKKQYFSFATIAIILQISSVYFFAAFAKTSDFWIKDFSALYYSFAGQHGTKFAGWLLAFPELLKFFTLFTPLLELLIAVFILAIIKQTFFRYLAAFGIFVLHALILVTLDIGLFPWACFLFIPLILPPHFWDSIRLKSLASRGGEGLVPRYYLLTKIVSNLCIITALCLMFFFCINAWTRLLPRTKNTNLRQYVSVLGCVFGSEQSWRMFHTLPSNVVWTTVVGKIDEDKYLNVGDWIEDGQAKIISKDQIKEKVLNSFEKERRPHSMRWYRYYKRLHREKIFKENFANSICNRWNLLHKDQKIKSVTLVSTFLPVGKESKEHLKFKRMFLINCK